MKALFANVYQNLLSTFWEIRNWIFVLVFYFFVVRVVEYIVLSEREVFALISLKDCLVGFLLDLYFVFLLWIVCAVLQSLFNRWKQKWITPFFVLLAIATHASLEAYFFKMNIPLDGSIYTFSLTELQIIIGLESRITVLSVALVILFFIVYIFLGKRLKRTKWNTKKRLRNALFIISIITWIVLPVSAISNKKNPQSEKVMVNKTIYFLDKSLDYAFTKPVKGTIRPSDYEALSPEFYTSNLRDSKYPCVHGLDDESSLEKVLNKSDGPPNIVIIIVESFSADLIGKEGKESGSPMPFMDSLSKNSLYFKNCFSTAKRTQNALPAVLGSLPIAPDGSTFQEISYPLHWTLPKLLKGSYYSRFYCGVYLEFLNMRKFMNHQETDYLVNNWDPKFEKEKAALNSPWGFPDGAVFEQAKLDEKLLNKERKPFFDVFLTCSTHEPFVYPNSEYYTKKLLKKANSIKNPQAKEYLLNNAMEVGSFSYTDDQLKKYFAAQKKKPEFKNTIYFIMGDHGSELKHENQLSYYHVPLVVYSPLLKQKKTVKNFVSHLDIAPSLVNYLKKVHGLKLPELFPFTGKELNLKPGMDMNRSFVFTGMGYKNEDVYQNGQGYFGEVSYSIDKQLRMTQLNDAKRDAYFKQQAHLYQLFSRYVITQNHILPKMLEDKYFSKIGWREFGKKSLVKTDDWNETYHILLEKKNFPASAKMAKVEVTVSVFLKSKEDLTKVPQLVTDIYQNHERKGPLYYSNYRNAELVGEFKANQWNTISYSYNLAIDPIKTLNNNNLFLLYFLNDKNKTVKFKNRKVSVSYYSNK